MQSFLYYAAVTSDNSCIAPLKFSHSFLLTYIHIRHHAFLSLNIWYCHAFLSYVLGSFRLSFLTHPILPCIPLRCTVPSTACFTFLLRIQWCHAFLFYVTVTAIGIPSRSKRQCHAVLSYISGSLAMQFFLKYPANSDNYALLKSSVLFIIYIGCRHVFLFYVTGTAMHSFPR